MVRLAIGPGRVDVALASNIEDGNIGRLLARIRDFDDEEVIEVTYQGRFGVHGLIRFVDLDRLALVVKNGLTIGVQRRLRVDGNNLDLHLIDRILSMKVGC